MMSSPKVWFTFPFPLSTYTLSLALLGFYDATSIRQAYLVQLVPPGDGH
jgi:hypothetical protein